MPLARLNIYSLDGVYTELFGMYWNLLPTGKRGICHGGSQASAVWNWLKKKNGNTPKPLYNTVHYNTVLDIT